MYPPKTKAQEAFELQCLQQMREVKKQQKEDILDELEFYIYEALSECDYVENKLVENKLSEANINDIYERVSFAKISLERATKELENMKTLIDDDES